MDNPFMARAIQLSIENVESGRGGPFGAVVVKDGVIIGEAANQVTSTNDPTTKAVHVARALDWKRSVKVQSVREEECGCGALAPHPHGRI